jgi:hypothetical protein
MSLYSVYSPWGYHHDLTPPSMSQWTCFVCQNASHSSLRRPSDNGSAILVLFHTTNLGFSLLPAPVLGGVVAQDEAC